METATDFLLTLLLWTANAEDRAKYGNDREFQR
jgi:hypothetical protein